MYFKEGLEDTIYNKIQIRLQDQLKLSENRLQDQLKLFENRIQNLENKSGI